MKQWARVSAVASIFMAMSVPWVLPDQNDASAPGAGLAGFVQGNLDELGLAGVGVGVIRCDGTRWARGFGLADLEGKVPAAPDTVAMWASCSKVVTGATILQALENRSIGLDESIGEYLPFQVVNPNFPEKPITFRMLLTHTSSLLDDRTTIDPLYGEGDAATGLGDFLREYLAPGGKFYKPSNYGDAAPGAMYKYGNVNFSLLGYLVERLTGKPFDEYCRQSFCRPLGVREAGWFLKDVDASRLARQYRAASAAGGSRLVPHYGWPGFPDGMFRCSVSGMLRIMAAFLGSDPKVLSGPVRRDMFKPQGIDPSQLKGPSPVTSLDSGLVWRLWDLDGRKVWSHTGNGSGLTTVILLDDKANAAGVAWISGGVLETSEGQAFFMELIRRLLAEMLTKGQR